MRIASTSGIEPEISHYCEMWQSLPRAHNPPIYFTLYARVLIHFRNFLDVPYSPLAKKCYICNVKWQIHIPLHHGKRSLTPISARRFFGTSRTFSSAAVNIWAVDGWWLWAYHGQCSFLKFRTGCFSCIVYFSPGATGRTYGIILTLPYSVPDTPNITYLWHSV